MIVTEPRPDVGEFRAFDVTDESTTTLYENASEMEPDPPTAPDVTVILRVEELPDDRRHISPVSLDQEVD